MSISDEILKLKQLLDSGAITQDEFNMMKARLLNLDAPAPQPQVVEREDSQIPLYTSTPSSSSTQSSGGSSSYIRKRYFNDTPFKVVGWISVGFAALFSLICIILLATDCYGAAMAMVWELSFLPGSLAIIMGAIVHNKSYSSALLVFGIILSIASLVVSIVTSVLYSQNIVSDYYSYFYY